MSVAGGEPSGGRVMLTISSDPVRMAEVRETVRQAGQQIGFVDPDLACLVLAVDEAIANVIRHGYEGRPGQPIEIVLEPIRRESGLGLQVVICDCGRQVDPATIAGRDLNNVRPGGLGTHIIRSIMDEVEYTCRDTEGMQLRMVKMLNPRTEGEAECPAASVKKE